MSENSSKAPAFRTRLLFLAVIGSAVSFYLLYHHISVNGDFQTGESICNFGARFNCDEVARSQFAELWGIPVAALGLWFYLMLIFFLTAFRPKPAHGAEYRARFADACFKLSLPALIPTVYYACASFFVVRSVCLFCSILYVINAALCLVAYKNPERKADKAGLGVLARGFPPLLQIVITVALAVIVWSLEPLLIKHWFVPRQEASLDRQHLLPLLCEWSKQKPIENLVDDSEDLLQRDYAHGARQAKIEFAGFSDFECPHCKRAANAFRPLVKKYPQDLRVVFKNFPLDSSCNELMTKAHHKFACDAAIMARCAGLQGEDRFWKMHDAIYELEEFSAEMLEALPAQVEVDQGPLEECMRSTAAKERIVKDVRQGGELGLEGTPSLFLNRRRWLPMQLEILNGVIQLLLKEPQLLENPSLSCKKP